MTRDTMMKLSQKSKRMATMAAMVGVVDVLPIRELLIIQITVINFLLGTGIASLTTQLFNG